MKYNKHAQMDISKQIYNGEMTCQRAAERYNVSLQTAKHHLEQYRNAYALPPKYEKTRECVPTVRTEPVAPPL